MAHKKHGKAYHRPLPSAASSFVCCPACQSQVIKKLINFHLDLKCPSLHKPGDAYQKEALDLVKGKEDETQVERLCHGLNHPDASSKEDIKTRNGENEADCAGCSQSSQEIYQEDIATKSTVTFLKYFASSFSQRAPTGHHIIEEFISIQEEQAILDYLDMDFQNPWICQTFAGANRGKSYGLVMDLRRRLISSEVFRMPKVLDPILERMRTLSELRQFFPNAMNVIDYRRDEGHCITPHVDDRQLSGITIVNISLCGECFMTFKKERGGGESYRIKLNRRALQIQTGNCRYNFTHSIKNEDLLHSRRVSVNIRETTYVP